MLLIRIHLLALIWSVGCYATDVPIGRQSKENPYLAEAKEAKRLQTAANAVKVAEDRYYSDLAYSRQVQRLREARLLDRLSITYKQYQMKTGFVWERR